jgi:hypothetical protein
MGFIQGYPKFKALLASGAPAVGYKLQSYLAGTSTPEPTFTDQTEGAQNANPTILDGNGEASIWLKPTVAYKLVLKTDADVVVWTLDGINTKQGGYFTALSVTTLSASGQITSTVVTGTAPLVIASTTKVANLNADLLDGKQWDTPDPIGAVTPSTGKFTTLRATAATVLETTADIIGLITHNANRILAAFGFQHTADPLVQIFGSVGKWTQGYMTEEILLSTSGTTTDSAANLLPANSVIEGVTAEVTQTITTATDWKLGDATTAGRFTVAQSGAQLTDGAQVVGLVHRDPSVVSAAGPQQAAAAKLRITTTGTPGAGRILVTVFYSQFAAS